MSLSLSTQLTEWVLPQLLTSGTFGPRCEISFRKDDNRAGEDQFASAVQFLELIVKSEDGIRNIKVVIKLQTPDQLIWDVINRKEQFQNEINMYSKVFPMLNKDGIIEELCCKYYFGISETNDGLNKDFLVLEDLSDQGYKLSSEKVFLDYNHCALAMKAIGKFHGLSYAAKQHDINLFKSTVSKLQSKWDNSFISTWKDMYEICGKRGIDPLINASHPAADLLKKFLKNYEDPVKFVNALFSPKEPEAVVCHGDFCRNNVLFHYDKDGHPDNVKLFDFQTPMYASPATDLSFFLYMNTTQKLRDKHWDDLIKIYMEGVKSVVPAMKVPVPDFKKYAAFGYMHVSFFLPFMVHDGDIPLKEIIKLNPHDQAIYYSKVGGEKGTQLLVDVIKHILDQDYIQASYH